jgi:glutathione S-transferase
MSLKLHYHPLASYCWKVLIALYENDTPFERQLVDLSTPEQRAALQRLSPFVKFPALEDREHGRTIWESTSIIEYLAQHYPGESPLISANPDGAFEVRRTDRFFDLYVHESMQKIVGDKLRPADKRDPFGVEQARAVLATAYDYLERALGSQPWAAGDAFSMADCSAAPALYYANRVAPFGPDRSRITAYLARLHARPSFARTFEEAQPYLQNFPG